MGKRPDTWMPFFVGDYLGDTMHLTRDQHGVAEDHPDLGSAEEGQLPAQPVGVPHVVRVDEGDQLAARVREPEVASRLRARSIAPGNSLASRTKAPKPPSASTTRS